MAEAPPRLRPLPGAALVAGPSAPPCLLCRPGQISAVSEQLCCGLGGPALRPVSTSGSLCRGLGSGCATAGRVPERWEAPLYRPQFPLMGGQAPSQLQVARSCRPGLSLLLGARDAYCPNRIRCAPTARPSSSPGVLGTPTNLPARLRCGSDSRSSGTVHAPELPHHALFPPPHPTPPRTGPHRT